MTSRNKKDISKTVDKKVTIKTFLMFIIPSFIGCTLFVIPVIYDGNLTILFGVLQKYIDKIFGPVLPLICVILTVISMSGAFVTIIFKPKYILNRPVLKSVFYVSLIWLLIRIIGSIIAIMVYTKIGPAWLISNNTGSLILNDLAPSCTVIFFLSGFLLPLLLEYGLMEFFGTLCYESFRKLFLLPGRAAIGCLASWFGAASTAVLITDTQYKMGYYTKRESCVMMTCFSISSIAFALIVITQLGMESYFFPFYLSVCLAGIVSAIIIPRIPPLSLKKNEYYNGINNTLAEETEKGFTKLQWAYLMALKKASNGCGIRQLLQTGLESAIGTMLGFLPTMVCIGTMSLVINEYTVFFRLAGVPFIPLLKLLKIPEAPAVASTLMGGFADNYIPAILGKNLVQSSLGKLVVGITSFNGVIFMSGTGAVMLQSKTPLTLWDLFTIFIERTIISIFIAALFARIIIFVFIP